MKIKIIAVGKLKEKYLSQGIKEYEKRLGGYCKLEIIEIPDEKAPENLSPADMIAIKEKEGERILAKIKDSDYVYALAIQGENFSSEEFAASMDGWMTQGKSTLTFIIGGSLGLADKVLARSQTQISFGRATYPHQLMRLILVEQVYRGFRIMRGHAYHK